MKLYSFGNTFVRSDNLDNILSMLDNTIEIWQSTVDENSSSEEKDKVLVFLSFLEDLKESAPNNG